MFSIHFSNVIPLKYSSSGLAWLKVLSTRLASLQLATPRRNRGKYYRNWHCMASWHHFQFYTWKWHHSVMQPHNFISGYKTRSNVATLCHCTMPVSPFLNSCGRLKFRVATWQPYQAHPTGKLPPQGMKDSANGTNLRIQVSVLSELLRVTNNGHFSKLVKVTFISSLQRLKERWNTKSLVFIDKASWGTYNNPFRKYQLFKARLTMAWFTVFECSKKCFIELFSHLPAHGCNRATNCREEGGEWKCSTHPATDFQAFALSSSTKRRGATKKRKHYAGNHRNL